MLVPPLQNQEMQHRSEAVGELRNQEHHKALQDSQQVRDVQQRKEESRSETVQPNPESETADPDGGSGRKERQRHSKSPPQITQEDEDAPRRLLGGQFVDLEA